MAVVLDKWILTIFRLLIIYMLGGVAIAFAALPTITSTEITTATEDVAYSYIFTATDTDVGDVLTFSAPVLPNWLSFDGVSGELSGIPDNDDVGSHPVTLRVNDGTDDVDQIFSITVSNVNDAPTISGTPITSIDEDSSFSFTPIASDVDVGDVLTFSIANQPSWADFDPLTGTLSGLPVNSDVGITNTILITVLDTLFASSTLPAFNIEVINTNDAPTISNSAITTSTEEEAYSYTFAVDDVDVGDVLTLSAPVLPSWLSFDDVSGDLTGTPGNAEVGSHPVTLRVNDGTVNVDQSFSITVANINDAPTISGTPAISIDEDSSYSFTPTAGDVDVGDSLTFSITNQPAWASFDTLTGILSGIPANDDVGVTNNIVITVTDDSLDLASASLLAFNLEVINTNDAPTITTTAVTTATEEVAYSYTFTATDVDVGDVLTLSAPVLPSWLIFDDATGELTGTPSNAEVGDHPVTLRVNDGSVDVDQAFTITVSNMNDAPVITSIAVITANEDAAYSYTMMVIDTDVGDVLTLSAPVLPTWLSFDDTNGELTGIPGNAEVGSHSVTLRVNDGTIDVDQSFDITVVNVNDVPIISGTPATTIDEDSSYSFTPTASDVDVGDSLTFSIANQPSWASFDSTTGTLSGVPTNSDVGTTTSVLITVLDASFSAASLPVFNLEVINTNDAPVISSIATTGAVQNVAYSYTFTVTDVDVGDVLTLSAPVLPSWLSFDDVSGALTGMPSNAEVGDHSVTLRVNDGAVDVDQSFTITVANSNDAPVITSTEVTVATEDLLYSYTITATDADISDVLTYSAVTVPGWLSFNASNHVLSGTPINDDVGSHAVTLRVSDGTVNVDQSFSVTVTNVNDAPVITSTAITGALQNVVYSYTFTSTDVDVGDVLTLSAPVLPSWLSFDDVSGALTGTPSNAEVGDHSVALRVNDGAVNVDQSFTITVANSNDAPVITSTEVTVATEDLLYSYTITATDADISDVLTYSAVTVPGWLSFNASTHVLSGTPINDDVGSHAVTLRVSDGTVNVDQSFSVTVANVNDAPVISSVATTGAMQNVAYSYTLTASDVDVGDVLTLSAPVLPGWLSFNTATGVLNGTPNNIHVGSHNVTLQVNDGNVNVDQSFIITVDNINDVPSITGTPAIRVVEGLPYNFLPLATDDDVADTLTFVIVNQPGWASFDSSTGALSGSPTAANIGTTSDVMIGVSDGSVTVNLPAFDLTVVGDLDGNGIGDDVDPDIDGDGMDNDFETNNGLDPLNSADATLDADGDGVNNLDEFLLGTNPIHDEVPPLVIAPADITVTATGLYTLVDFGEATAVDELDGVLPAVSDLDNHLSPGVHTVIWSATDNEGNAGTDTQIINIVPLVDFSINQVSVEGNAVEVKVLLNGSAVNYPVEVPYTVSGSASIGVDHDLIDGMITINSGTETMLTFNIINDGTGDSDESIVITMGTPTNAAPGFRSVHTVKIVEGNVAPQVKLSADQGGTTRIISQAAGMVTVVAELSDPNSGDVHTFDWSDSDNALVDTDASSLSFSFDPLTVSPGLYIVRLNVSDGVESDEAELALIVMTSVPALTTADSDGDGINDAAEGYGDDDNDGIPNYLDAIAVKNILQAQSGSSDQHLIETESGLSLALGQVAFQADPGQAVITSADIVSFSGLPEDSLPNLGGLFDFVVTGLSEAGESVRVVLPQLVAVSDDAGFRKLMPTGWQDFVSDNKNIISSAAGESAYCPPPGDAAYTPGLTAGHWCVQLLIEDGGPNDADLSDNKRIVDPGGLVQLQNVTVDVSSSGGAIYLLPLLLILWRLWIRLQVRRV